ncbi:right-handed parallel beta-helix repeat-containing protein [Candidatus Nomurabacteria bacterium]|nr:right-handed parallel beta-helix repeat-containing protein [Candidatus Nomurabacteria bacterium]
MKRLNLRKIILLSVVALFFGAAVSSLVLLKAALVSKTFFIDQNLTEDCLQDNYSPSTRSCTQINTGYSAWSRSTVGLKAIQTKQSSGEIQTGGNTIYFREGIYRDYLTSYYWPNGVAGRPNKIEGYQDEEVIFSAGVLKTAWEDMGNGLYRTTLVNSEDAYRGVFEDGQVLYSARYPEDNLDRLESSMFTREYLIDSDLNVLPDEKIIGSWAEIMTEYLWHKKAKIVAYDRETSTATFSTDPNENDFLLTNPDESFKYGDPTDTSPYHLIDNLNLLDSAGEYLYQLGEQSEDPDYVYVRTISGGHPSAHIVEIPSRSTAVYFGTNGEYESYHIEFRNFDIRYAGSIGLYVYTKTTSRDIEGNHDLVFDDLHIYNNGSTGAYFYAYYNPNYTTEHYNENIIFKNSLAENNGGIGLYYYGPNFGVNGSQYHSVNSEIYNNQFINNGSCGTLTYYTKDLSIHDNYHEGNGLFNLASSLSIHNASDIEVYNNHIVRAGGNGMLLEGTADYRVARINIHNNIVEDPAYFAPGWVTGIWLSDTDDSLVQNNTFYTPYGIGLHIDAGQNNVAIYNKFLDILTEKDNSTYPAVILENSDGTDPDLTWAYSINNTIAHNIFVGDFKYGLKVYADMDAPDGDNVRDNTIANNIFYSTSPYKVIPASLAYDVDHSLNTYNNNLYYAPNASEVKFVYQDLGDSSTAEYVFADYKTHSSQESLSLQTNPLFTNFSQENFTLQSNSPAIDQGMLISGVNTNNFQGFAPDIGLLEYASGPTCSNSILESGETCDDGNLNNGDGCSSTCQIEQETPPPASCTDNIQNGNETGIDCGGSCPACDNGGGNQPPPPPENPPIACGNSIQESGETCDDGNLNNGDGCSYLCQIEEDNQATSTTNSINVLKAQGFLAKAPNDPRVYYINQESKRYYIPNLTTFYTWFNNFNSLQVIDQVTLNNSYPYEGRLTVKPGNLVKFQDSNKVYAIEPEKTLRWITSGNIFSDFGYDFNKIIHLPQEDFSYYTIGENITTSDIHPSGQLLKHGSYPQVFYVQDGIEYWIKDQNTFLSLGFKWQDIITIPVRYWYTRILDNLSFKLKDW